MRFYVEGTSTGSDPEEPPYNQAFLAQGPVTIRKWRVWSSLEEAAKHPCGADWLSTGTNHRVENGMCVCDVVHDEPLFKWQIEFNTLEELTEFVKTHGDVVIWQSDVIECPLGIELYDDYRK